jgi:pantetheine-phosphate adenylyltransferase
MAKEKKIAIYPGTFDPITKGHLDIIKRAISIFDEVIVAVAKNPSKKVLFSYLERLKMVKEIVKKIEKVKVEGLEGLVVNFAKEKKAKVIIRGLRMVSDFEYEFQMALTNRNLDPQIETIFLMPHPRYSYISSRLIKEAAFLGADLEEFLPKYVIKILKKKIKEAEIEDRSRKNKG